MDFLASLTLRASVSVFFFFNDTATTEIYTLSLHDALPISLPRRVAPLDAVARDRAGAAVPERGHERRDVRGVVDRKSTRLNSSHSQISYAVFCLKKKKEAITCRPRTRHRDALIRRYLAPRP